MAVLDAARGPRRRVLLVINPASRRGARFRDAACRAFDEIGATCDVCLTSAPGDGARMALERHTTYDAVFTLGGDGTAMEIVGALAGLGRPVGILPGGTGNLLARTLGIPLGVERAVRLLMDGDAAQVDLGHLTNASLSDGRRFAFAAGVGIDAAMIEAAPTALKRRFGVLAYVLSAARAVLRRETFTVRATVDGETIERTASAVMVANFGAVLNELITLGPGIRHDDGLLSLCVFSPGTLLDALHLVWRLFRKDFRTSSSMLYRQGRHFRIETTPPRQTQADGELLGQTPFEVSVEPRAALLLVPKRRRR